ncbi:putative protein OS=Ureibacillus acetophenoni OX=614649 GN=SAMN05877842_10892 PE=4 SV=1 [Ureibacillus acetophenoni]
MLFNTNFFKSMFDGQRVLEMKAPNGAVYRFATNTIDEKTLNDFRYKLEEATKNNDQNAFDQTWNELTGDVRLSLDFEGDFKQLQNQVLQLFNRNPFFSNSNFPLLIDPFFSQAETKSIPEELSIDQQIEQYQQKIEELQKQKNNINKENRKQQILDEIANKKNNIDAKLDEFAKNLDNEEMKKKLTDEMTKLNEEIKQLENELQSL